MTTFGIIGGPGCGKSLLTRQLAACGHAPFIPEGEIGVFPSRMLKAISSGKDQVYLFDWWLDHYEARIAAARKVSKIGLDCFLECSAECNRPYANIESVRFQKMIERKCRTLSADVDVIVLLNPSPQKMRELITRRNRKHEQNERFVSRAIAVQAKFVEMFKKRPNVIVINRDSFDFLKEGDVAKVYRRIMSFARRVDRSAN